MAETAPRFVVEYPVHSAPHEAEWIDPSNVAHFAYAIESAGLDAIAFTDHPAPPAAWLAEGGHETFDPFVALGFCAAATSTLRLMTRLVVLPYRNPLLTAKSMATVDVLSGGRATFVLGTGYLRSEFDALGVCFDDRNALFDEAVEAMIGVWTKEPFVQQGQRFNARGQAGRPRPVQQPHPPLWLGGNSSAVIDRVVRFGQGWSPLQGAPALGRFARTPVFETIERLAVGITNLNDRLQSAGRDPREVSVLAGTDEADLSSDMSPRERIERIERLTAIGVTHILVRLPRGKFNTAVQLLRSFGQDVIQSMV